jgi:hypothetical protein
MHKRVVAIVGPSRAGKTTLLDMLRENAAMLELANSPELLDLDVELGEGDRSNVSRAADLVHSYPNRGGQYLLVNVGAGQTVWPQFRTFLQNEPALTLVAIWCDEPTFLSRHSAKSELQNNYNRELCDLWQACRDAGRLVDTSRPITQGQSLAELVRILHVATKY